jgi:hypothetical protein
MNKIVAVVFSFAAAGFSPVFAQTATSTEPLRLVSTTEAKLVPVAGSQDGDVGLEGYTANAGCSPIYSSDVSPVGTVFGDDEKDTVARAVVGTDCP